MKVLAQVDDLQPVYHTAQRNPVRQGWLRSIEQPLLIRVGPLDREENLPQSLLDKYKLMSVARLFALCIFPGFVEYKQALRRIKFEELFIFRCGCSHSSLKIEFRSNFSSELVPGKVSAVKESLPFAPDSSSKEFAGNFDRHEVRPP